MANVKITESEESFIIEVKKNFPLTPSKSGKTFLLASTNGFEIMNGYSFGLNVFTKKV